MVEIQLGSTKQPILIVPRIAGNVVTQTQIKNNFSNYYVNDVDTPIAFVLEYRTRTGTKAEIAWDSSSSSDSEIYFLPPDAFYATKQRYTVLIYWTIGVEKVYTENPFVIDVKELHDEY